MKRDYISEAEVIEGDIFAVTRGKLERHFEECKTPVILIDILGEDVFDDNVGFIVYKYSKMPKKGEEAESTIIAEISFDDIMYYGIDKKLRLDINWNKIFLNKYLATHCNRNKIFITIRAIKLCDNSYLED